MWVSRVGRQQMLGQRRFTSSRPITTFDTGENLEPSHGLPVVYGSETRGTLRTGGDHVPLCKSPCEGELSQVSAMTAYSEAVGRLGHIGALRSIIISISRTRCAAPRQYAIQTLRCGGVPIITTGQVQHARLRFDDSSLALGETAMSHR